MEQVSSKILHLKLSKFKSSLAWMFKSMKIILFLMKKEISIVSKIDAWRAQKGDQKDETFRRRFMIN